MKSAFRILCAKLFPFRSLDVKGAWRVCIILDTFYPSVLTLVDVDLRNLIAYITCQFVTIKFSAHWSTYIMRNIKCRMFHLEYVIWVNSMYTSFSCECILRSTHGFIFFWHMTSLTFKKVLLCKCLFGCWWKFFIFLYNYYVFQ